MIDADIIAILLHYENGLTVREILDKLLPASHEYNDISIICHKMVNRGILLRDRNEQDVFLYKIADRTSIIIPPPNKDSSVTITSYLDQVD